ncbi:hypothetical protein PFICI_10211 [Pestalotiopsis fici W106-1]|uniref:DUF7726 domain-containing protein n=1 Tax=Pestalotiopsis fici (strain W106-1 / CGMCC3.15140) TaxID=1229662 RepID=W3WWG8_PESFW|nr:uncharacterized protein PFICI_10211 [Pestalotiopsis fici W106-1]ETS78149.1 hypothetical protein PFICI_10211 [Pestalotiopsis fici W106-1]
MASSWSWDPATVRQSFGSSSSPFLPPNQQIAPPAPQTGKENIQPALPAPQGPKPNTSVAVPSGEKPSTEGTKTAAATKAASRKRKSDAVTEPEPVPEIDDDDPRLDYPDESAQKVRAKVRRFIDSGAMKVGEFQKAIDVGSVQYYRYMNQNGTDAGSGSDMYYNAWKFFKKRELQGVKNTAPKKAKTTATAKASGKTVPDSLDVGGVTLDGEDKGPVPVYDTCDEVRKKIRAQLRKDDVTQAAFLREIGKSFNPERKIQSKQLNDFLAKKGPLDGNTSAVFYGSYVFFEKLRVKQNKPKSATRLEMEKIYGKEGGVNITEPQNRGLWLLASESAYTDKYGQTHIVKD